MYDVEETLAALRDALADAPVSLHDTLKKQLEAPRAKETPEPFSANGVRVAYELGRLTSEQAAALRFGVMLRDSQRELVELLLSHLSGERTIE